MNILKSAMRAMKRWWWWMPASSIGAFFLILLIARAAQWFAGDSRVSPLGVSPELPFFGLGFHGYVLVAIATIGVPFAIWRGLAMQQQSEAASKQSEAALKQSEAALKQSEVALKQSNIAQSNLLDDRYQTGVEMLGSQVLPVRLGGIYALERVAETDPPAYHIPTMSVLSAFIRNSQTKDKREDKRGNAVPDNEQKRPSEDVCAILEVIGRRNSKQREIESERKYTVNLKGVWLRGWERDAPIFAPDPDFSNVDFFKADLSEADLSRVKFPHVCFVGANLSGAKLLNADLSHASFFDADLSDALLAFANLFEARFDWVKLFGTDLEKADGLTQAQINSAKIDTQRPPVLTNTVDSNTKQPLIIPFQSH